MNITLALALAVIAALLNATRDVPPNARTAAQIWDTARTAWRRVTYARPPLWLPHELEGDPR